MNSSAPRLTLNRILREAAARFFNLERGWLRTARELFTQPGVMIRRYIEGERAIYANPLSYLLVTTALSLVLQNLTGFQERFLKQIEVGNANTPGQMEFVRDFTEILFQNTLYASLAVLIPFALLLRLFFRKSGFNVAEMFVFALYAGGHVAILGIVLVFVTLWVSISTASYSASGLIVALVYYSLCAVAFFGGRFGTIVKTCLAYVLSFALIMIFSAVGAIIYLLNFDTSYTQGDDWNLVTSAAKNMTEVGERLIEEGVDINQTLLKTPLHVASEKGHSEMVELLLKNGADLNAQDYRGRVPMFLALLNRHHELAWQLRRGTNLNIRSDDGTTLLMMAIHRGDEKLARYLIEEKVNVNAVRRDDPEATALMIAAKGGELPLVELLLESGARTDVTNEKGKTALDLARSKEVAERLRSAMPHS